MALFGITAKKWKSKNPDKNSNLENLNSVFINDGLNQSERLKRLNSIAISQMKILSEANIKYLNK